MPHAWDSQRYLEKGRRAKNRKERQDDAKHGTVLSP